MFWGIGFSASYIYIYIYIYTFLGEGGGGGFVLGIVHGEWSGQANGVESMVNWGFIGIHTVDTKNPA